MVTRSLHFFEKYGPALLKEDIIFEDSYTEIITTGDADFLTHDTLWDMKFSKKGPIADYTLQLFIYYLMGKQSKLRNSFNQLSKIGVFNPRLNTAYSLEVDSINPVVIEAVSKNVIGY